MPSVMKLLERGKAIIRQHHDTTISSLYLRSFTAFWPILLVYIFYTLTAKMLTIVSNHVINLGECDGYGLRHG